MHRKILVVAAAVFAASVSVLATVEVLPNGNIFVGRGDVLSVFHNQTNYLPTTFDQWGLRVRFNVTLAQAYEQDCYETGAQPSPTTFVGVRTGTARFEGSVDHSVRLNRQAVITGYELTRPSNASFGEIDWDGNGSGDPGGSGCREGRASHIRTGPTRGWSGGP
jgi:hypothetical protein